MAEETEQNPFEMNVSYNDRKEEPKKLPTEKERVKEWVEEVGEHKEELDRNDVAVVRASFYSFLKFFFVMVIILMIVFGSFLAWAVYNERFKAEISQGVNAFFNATSNTFNDYENNFDNSFDNQFDLEADTTVIIESLEIVCEPGGCT